MKSTLRTLALLAALGMAGAAAVVFLGLYNVSARVGHLPGVSWILHTTFDNAVALRAPDPTEVPDLAQPGMVALGARHFDAGCKLCHGAPGQERWAIPGAMLPRPPHIAEAIEGWQPGELHWIVHQGVKMSGMPYWPATRRDDVWPVVAFLEAVPTMSGADYAALTAPPAVPEDTPEALASCATCHGLDGRSDNPFIPRLDIQPRAYLEQSLRAYADGTRQSGIMRVAASLVPAGELEELAGWYADRSVTEQMASDVAVDEDAAALARRGTRDVPACTFCHGPDAAPRAADFPRLAGQSAPYLEQQLRLWRDGARGGGGRANLMTKAARGLSDADIAALSAWYAMQPPADP